jgi:hypothetical protein
MANARIREILCLLGAATLLACGDDAAHIPDDDANSGFDETESDGMFSTGPTGPGTADTGPGSNTQPDPTDPGTDDGEPPGPDDGVELCDAGDEAFVKKLIAFTHGRRPESIREVRLLVSMIEQIDMAGEDGRRAVALGLMRGDQYLERWFTYLYEELRVNRAGDRRNDTCYDIDGGHGNNGDLAAFIRDNDALSQWGGGQFWMPDVVYSGLRLDDMTPIYRADLYARMSAPLIAGNVTPQELEQMRLTNYGSSFEQVYLGRNTECLECHRAEESVTWSPIEDANRHFPVMGNLELAVYGPDAPQANPERSYALFRYFNFAVGQDITVGGAVPGGYVTAFGFGPSCGAFRLAAPGTPGLPWDPYLIENFPAGATIVDFDDAYRAGFEALRGGGLDVAGDGSVGGAEGAAYLTSMHFADRLWVEAMGFPLVVANGFSRNADQRDVLQHLADTFVSTGYSLRELAAEIATHDLYNQAAPADCDASTPYHLPAVFDPFTKGATDPGLRRNGVGDGAHRYGAWVLLDAIAQAMWWNKPDHFGPNTGQIPEYNCGGDMPQIPCVEEPLDSTVLRDLGAFMSDSDSGFEGTDLLALLRLENDFGNGDDPGMNGDCTGPLGQACASEDWITQLIDEALSQNGADMWDVAAAVKDRFITQPEIAGAAEVGALEEIMGVQLTDSVSDVGAGQAEQAARRLVGVLVNTPQFLLAGVPAPDQDPAEDPVLVVPGTGTAALCEYLAPLVLDNPADGYDFDWSCSGEGVSID